MEHALMNYSHKKSFIFMIKMSFRFELDIYSIFQHENCCPFTIFLIESFLFTRWPQFLYLISSSERKSKRGKVFTSFVSRSTNDLEPLSCALNILYICDVDSWNKHIMCHFRSSRCDHNPYSFRKTIFFLNMLFAQ